MVALGGGDGLEGGEVTGDDVVGATGTAVVGAATTGGGVLVAVGVVAAGAVARDRRLGVCRRPASASLDGARPGLVVAGASPDATDRGSAASPIRCVESWLPAQATAAAAAIPSRAASTDMIARRLIVSSS